MITDYATLRDPNLELCGVVLEPEDPPRHVTDRCTLGFGHIGKHGHLTMPDDERRARTITALGKVEWLRGPDIEAIIDRMQTEGVL